MLIAVLFGIYTALLTVFLFSFLRAVLLFWPTMLVLGAVHSYIPMVPAWGWITTFFVVWLLGLLIPTNTTINKR